MKAAVVSIVNETLGLREASIMHNIPVELLRRQVNGGQVLLQVKKNRNYLFTWLRYGIWKTLLWRQQL